MSLSGADVRQIRGEQMPVNRLLGLFQRGETLPVEENQPEDQKEPLLYVKAATVIVIGCLYNSEIPGNGILCSHD